MNDRIRAATYTKEFDEYYQNLPQKIKDKYDYVFEIMLTKYVVSTKFVKRLEKTEFYEMRVSVSSNEYRSIIFAIDADSFIQSKKVLMLNSFLKKDTKQYRTELKKAETIYNAWRIEYEED